MIDAKEADDALLLMSRAAFIARAAITEQLAKAAELPAVGTVFVLSGVRIEVTGIDGGIVHANVTCPHVGDHVVTIEPPTGSEP